MQTYEWRKTLVRYCDDCHREIKRFECVHGEGDIERCPECYDILRKQRRKEAKQQRLQAIIEDQPFF